MKRLFTIFSLPLICLGLASCEIDNFEGPNASIHGTFVDSKDHTTLIGTDTQNGNQITVYEQTYVQDKTNAETWYVMNTGEFRNDRIFAADYVVEFKNTNFYPYTGDPNLTVKTGDNEKTFEVTPFLRVIDPKIVKEGNKAVATFRIEAGGPDVKLNEAKLFVWTDKYVGNQFNLKIAGTAAYTVKEDIDPSKVYTLVIDQDASSSVMKYKGRKYYFRIGVQALETNTPKKYGTIRHNYSPLVVLDF